MRNPLMIGAVLVVLASGLMHASASFVPTQTSASYLQRICAQNDPICAPYLMGIFDGLLEAAKSGGRQMICPQRDMDGGQAKQIFLTAMAVTMPLQPQLWLRRPSWQRCPAIRYSHAPAVDQT
jgi:hypothetical protein